MKVVCANDFPFGVLPNVTTDAEADAICSKLQDADPRNIEAAKGNTATYTRPSPIYYHWHDVPVLEAA